MHPHSRSTMYAGPPLERQIVCIRIHATQRGAGLAGAACVPPQSAKILPSLSRTIRRASCLRLSQFDADQPQTAQEGSPHFALDEGRFSGRFSFCKHLLAMDFVLQCHADPRWTRASVCRVKPNESLPYCAPSLACYPSSVCGLWSAQTPTETKPERIFRHFLAVDPPKKKRIERLSMNLPSRAAPSHPETAHTMGHPLVAWAPKSRRLSQQERRRNETKM